MKFDFDRIKDKLILICLLFAATVLLYRVSVTVGLLFTVLTAAYLAYLLSSNRFGRFRFHHYNNASTSQTLFKGLERVAQPALIIDKDDKIVWANRRFHERFGNEPVLNDLLFGELNYRNIEDHYKESEYSFELAFGSDMVSIVSIDRKGNRKNGVRFGLILSEHPECSELQRQLEDCRTAVGLISFDNAAELFRISADKVRAVIPSIKAALNEWAEQNNMLINQYSESDFLVLMDGKVLESCIADGFSIIEKIAKLTTTDFGSPITISIGISGKEGTLSQKYKEAGDLLETAFQKGGAVAIVNRDGTLASFGGHIKSAQKETSLNLIPCHDKLVNELENCRNVLIMGHKNPDFDCLGASIGIARFVMKNNVPVKIVMDNTDPNIEKGIAFLKSMPDYNEIFISPETAMESVNAETLLVCVDASNPAIFYAPNLFERVENKIVIDHHISTLALERGSVVDTNASSASELVSEIFMMSYPKGVLQKPEAMVMLAGIAVDTEYFSRNTGKRLFEACSFLQESGASLFEIKQLLKSNEEELTMTMELLKRRKLVGNAYYVSPSPDATDADEFQNETKEFNQIAASKAADRLVAVDGVKAAFVVYLNAAGNACISARSDGTLNVGEFVTRFNGGGHFEFAGASPKNEHGEPITSVSEVSRMLEEAILQNLNPLS